MIRLDDDYSPYRDESDPLGYPGGKAKPVSQGNKTDGTPWRALFFNTIYGFFSAVIMEAYSDFLVDGEPDKVGQSDLLNALKKLMREAVNPGLDHRIALNTSGIAAHSAAINFLNQLVQNFTEEAPQDGRLYARKNKTWAEVSGGGSSGTATGDAIEAFKFYSKKSVMFTNAKIVDRRQRGWDIGLPYLSAASDVYHFDTDMLNQNQLSNITLGWSGDAPILVGKDDLALDIYFNPAVKETPPYEMKGRSIFGNMSISAAVTGNVATAEFWARLFDTESAQVFRFGSALDEIALNLGGADPAYSAAATGDIPYGIADENNVLYSVAGTAGNRLDHSWQGGSESVDLDAEGVSIDAGAWIHIAAVVTQDKMALFIDDKKIEVNRSGQAAAAKTLSINEGELLINIDELLIDNTAALAFDAFIQNTAERIPYAALPYTEKWFVLEAQDVNKVKTNLFETEQFRAAVEAVINS